MKILRCNRCKAEAALPETTGDENPMAKAAMTIGFLSSLRGWSIIKVNRIGMMKPPAKVLDLCEDCVEVLLEQFMVGASVAPITTPLDQTLLPHAPMLDCQFIWNPGAGRLICRHDDPELFDALVVDQDNAVEGAGDLTCDQVNEIQDAVQRMKEDVDTAAVAHAVPKRCGRECSEAHTYEAGCLLEGVVRIPEQRESSDPRHVSQNGEDLTDAYSPQEPADDEKWTGE